MFLATVNKDANPGVDFPSYRLQRKILGGKIPGNFLEKLNLLMMKFLR